MPLYKPVFDHGGGGIVNPTGNKLNIYDSSGKLINTVNAQRGTEGSKFVFNPNSIKPGYTYDIDNGDKYIFDDPTQRQEFNPTGGGKPTAVGGRGSMGNTGVGGNIPGGSQPGQVGSHGFFPAYLGGQFPSPVLANYNPITAAPYKNTDVMEFAKQYGDFNRGEIKKNFDLSKDLALQTLDTELMGLKNFVPAASALKRSETSLDNVFNQAERTKQLDTTLPEVRGQLNAQGARAEAYASGRAPDEVTDRALELGVRSAAADNANAGGFGNQSSVARKASDLMSAQQRIQLSQYGDQLLSANINQKAAIELAPTEYSDAGSQVRVTPEVGAGRLTSSFLGEVNAESSVPATTALGTTVQQEQFTTGLEQQTRQFNAGNELQLSEFNAGTSNDFALQKFGYEVGFAGTVAGAAQTNDNTNLALQQQDLYRQQVDRKENQAQQGDLISSIGGAIGSIVGGAAGFLKDAQLPSGGQVSGGASGAGSAGEVSSGGAVARSAADLSPSPLPSSSSGGGAQSSAPISVPASSSIPSGYVASGAGAGGSTIAIPSSGGSTPLQTFAQDTGASLASSIKADPNQAVTRSLLAQSGAVLNSAGVFNAPVQGTQYVGNLSSGAPLYSSSKLVSSSDSSLGASAVDSVRSSLQGTGVFGGEDLATLNSKADVAKDSALMSKLDGLNADGNTSGFVDAVMSSMGQPGVESIGDNTQALGTAFTAHQLSQVWDQMSPAQKGLALGAVALQATKFSDGTTLNSKVLAKGQDGDPSLTAAKGLELQSKGVNLPSLTSTWGDLNTLHKVAAGQAKSPDSVAGTAVQFNTLGWGLTGAAVPQVTKQSLESDGWRPAPQYGVGAVTGNAGAQIPKGYTQVLKGKDGSQVVVPRANVSSAVGSLSTNTGTLAGTKGGTSGVSLSANNIYKKWGDPSKAAIGVAGGSQFQGSLSQMSKSNPFVLSGMISASTFGGIDQRIDDKVSKHLSDMGVISEDGKSFINAKGENVKIQSLPATLSHDKYIGALVGVALGRLVSGGIFSDKTGASIGAAASTVKDLRAMYSRAGIKSKGDAYQLANQGYAEGRFSEVQVTAMHKAFDAVFDPNPTGAINNLLSGKDRGLEVAKSIKNPIEKVVTPERRAQAVKFSKDELKHINRMKYQQSQGAAA